MMQLKNIVRNAEMDFWRSTTLTVFTKVRCFGLPRVSIDGIESTWTALVLT